MKVSWFRILLWASAMAFAPQLNAQAAEKEAEPPANAPSPESLLKVSDEEANASAADARVELLEQQINALQAQLDDLKKALPKATPSWKGAPQWADSEGWSFKARGRLHFDAGGVSTPGALQNRNLGFNARARRIRLGFEGAMPGGFGYKAEADFANAGVTFGDVWLVYNAKSAPIQVRIGNQESLNSMEQVSSSNFVSFTERVAFNDGFTNARRIGAVIGYYPKDTNIRLEAGLFSAHSIDSSLDNDGWIAAGRLNYSPMSLGGQLHFGLNVQHREFSSNNGGTASVNIGAPSTNQLGRYRARPFTQLTDVRFVDTGAFAAKGDTLIGLELAGIWKGFYASGEAQWVRTTAYDAGDIATGLDVFAGGNSAVVPTGNPGFFGAYGEVGYFLTGETRGYGNALWQRTKVLKPFNKGGWGAFQIAARYDYLDLDSSKLKNGLTNNFTTGATSLAAASARLGRGGTQQGFLLGLNWYPTDYVRFMLNYIHTNIEGGPLAASVKPLSTKPVDQRSYSTDGVALRAQVDF